MPEIPFVAPFDDVAYGKSEQVSPLIRRVVANNASKFTYKGTGTYIIGHGDVVVVDPGPILETHRDALLSAIGGERVVGIVVTHCHADHSPLSAWLKDKTGAPTYAFGPHGQVSEEDDGNDLEGNDLEGDDLEGEIHAEHVREHVDVEFIPDIAVGDGEVFLSIANWKLTGVHTPGHTSNHLCVELDAERALFSGDHVMGWSTTVISPPDGNMTDYFASLRKVQRRGDQVLWPTHGNPVRDPQPFLKAYLAHREEREAQVLSVVTAGVSSIPAMVEQLYANVRKELHKAAGRSVYAHLLKLIDDGRVATANGEQPHRKGNFWRI